LKLNAAPVPLRDYKRTKERPKKRGREHENKNAKERRRRKSAEEKHRRERRAWRRSLQCDTGQGIEREKKKPSVEEVEVRERIRGNTGHLTFTSLRKRLRKKRTWKTQFRNRIQEMGKPGKRNGGLREARGEPGVATYGDVARKEGRKPPRCAGREGIAIPL